MAVDPGSQRGLVGSLIGRRYRVEKILGEGASGTVLEVRDQGTDLASLALKLAPSSSLPARQSLIREYRTLSRLSHPNLVPAERFGIEPASRRAYFIMERVEGLPLDEACTELSLEETVDRFSQLARGLAFIHSRGLVHLDVKPENVLVTPEGRVRILDLGFALPVGSRGPGRGTPHYTAPETLDPDVRVDARADLYALGVMLYRLLTGEFPYQGESAAEVLESRVRGATPARPRRLRPELTEIRPLVNRLLAEDPDQRPASAGELIREMGRITGLPLQVETMETRLTRIGTAPLVGRERELEAATSVLQAAHRRGRVGVILVEGEGGAGMGRLLDEIRRMAETEGFLVASTAAWRDGSPYGVAAAVLRRLIPEVDPNLLARQRPLLARILSELGEPAPPERGISPADERTRLGLKVTDLVSNVCRRQPVMIAVEGLQRTDTGSLSVLELLARQRDTLPLVLAFTVNRSIVAAPGAVSTIQAIQRIPGALRLPLKPISVEDCERLLAAMFGQPAPRTFVAALHSATGGNPLLIRETLGLLTGEGELWDDETGWVFDPLLISRRVPESLEAIIPRVLERLPHSTAELIRSLAVLAHPVRLGVLRALRSQVEEPGDIGGAIRTGFLRWRRGPDDERVLGFGSQIVRESVMASLEPEVRAGYHLRALSVLRAREDSDPVELAWHHLRGEPGLEAFQRAVQQASRCRALADLDTAAELYATALALELEPRPPDRRAALLQYAQVLLDLSRPEALPILIAEVGEMSTSPEETAELHQFRARYLIRIGELDRAEKALDDGLRELSDQPPGQLCFALQLGQLDLLIRRTRFQAAVVLAREVLEGLPEVTEDERLLDIRRGILAGLGHAQHQMGLNRESERAYLEAQEVARSQNDRVALVLIHVNLASVVDELGEVERAEELWTSALEMAQRIGLPHSEAILHHNLGNAALRRGDVRAAREKYRRTLEISERINDRPILAHGQTSLALDEMRRGRMAEARRLLQLALETARDVSAGSQMLYALSGLSQVLRQTGRMAEAWNAVREQRELAKAEGSPLHLGTALAGQGRLELELGRYEQARDLARSSLELLAECEGQADEPEPRLVLAWCWLRERRFQELRLELEALDTLRELVRPHPDHAGWWLDLVELRLALGDREAAAALLEQLQRMWPKEALLRFVSLRQEVVAAELEEDAVRTRRSLRRVLAVAQQSHLVPLQIRSLGALARLALDRGRMVQARENLRQARKWVERLTDDLAPEHRETFQDSPLVRPILDLESRIGISREAGPEMDGERLELLAGLERQALDIHGTLDLDEVLTRTTDSLIELVGARSVLLLLGGPGEMAPTLARREGGEDAPASEIAPDPDLISEALQSGGLALSGDRAAVALRQPGGEVIGAFLAVGSQDLDSRRIPLPVLAAFADQAATAILNARLHHRVERARRGAQELTQVIQELARCTELDPLLRRVTDGAIELADADRGVLLLQGAAGGMEVRIARNRERLDLPVEGVRISFSTARQVARDKVGIQFLDLGEDGGGALATDSIRDLALLSILAVPILREEEVLGVLYLDSRRRPGRGFDPEDLAHVESLCSAAGVAIGNARLMEELRASNQELRNLDEMKSKFTDLVSHELGTPLSIVSGYLEVLSAQLVDRLEPDERESLQGAQEAVDRLEQATAAVVNLSRLRTARTPIQPRPCRIGPVIRQVMEELRPSAESRSQILTDHPPSGDVVCLLDPVEIGVALRNLVLNAIRYTPDGGKIDIRVRSDRERLKLMVEDTGIGIPEEEHNRIFRRFYEASDTALHSSGSTSFRSGGLGLGLAVAQSIVEAHGGRIKVASQVGQGSTFTIELPR